MNHGEFLISFLIDLQRIFRTEVVPKDLPYSQVQAIIIIPSDGIEMSELSWTLGLDNSTVTRLIERLEVKGFVTRKKNKSQKKKRQVSTAITTYLTTAYKTRLKINKIKNKTNKSGERFEEQGAT